MYGVTPMPEPASRNLKPVLIAGALLLALAATVAIVAINFHAEGDRSVTNYAAGDVKAGHLAIDARVVTVDPVKGEMVVRLQFAPQGDLLSGDGFSPTKDLILNTSGAAGKSVINFKKGERMNPSDIILDTVGPIADYPFDEHDADLILILHAPSSKGDAENIPFNLVYSGNVEGYRIEEFDEAAPSPGFLALDVHVSRSSSARLFAVFIMVLEWLLALSAAAVVFVWIRGRRIEVTMFGWMGALLFALVPLRSAMPSVPPVGVLSDFLSFFWAEGVVAVSLVAAVSTWVMRRPT